MKKHQQIYAIALFAIVVLFVENGWSQTTHKVIVTNDSFSPANITIAQGDIVQWDCIQGTHNVNGTKTTFPGNPLSFGNSVQSANWSYSFTFTAVGQYNYRCDPHFAFGMVGTVTVNATTGVGKNLNENRVSVFVDKASSQLMFRWMNEPADGGLFNSLQIFNTTGAMVYNSKTINGSSVSIDVSKWPSTIYLFTLSNAVGHSINGKVLVSR